MIAIAPGWLIVLLLAALAVALFFAFIEGDARDETLDYLGLGEDHVAPRVAPYDQERDFLEPNERCTLCGTEVEQHHDRCHEHRYCLTECPACGGPLEKID